MTDKTRATYSVSIKLETAQLVLEQGYTQVEVARVMGVGKSTVSKWVSQLKLERQGIAQMTPEQIEIRELKKKTTSN